MFVMFCYKNVMVRLFALLIKKNVYLRQNVVDIKSNQTLLLIA